MPLVQRLQAKGISVQLKFLSDDKHLVRVKTDDKVVFESSDFQHNQTDDTYDGSLQKCDEIVSLIANAVC